MPSFEEALSSLRGRIGLPATPPQVQQAMSGQTVSGRKRRIEDMLAELRKRAGAGDIPNLSDTLRNAGQAGAPGGQPNYQAMAAALAAGLGRPPWAGAGAERLSNLYSTLGGPPWAGAGAGGAGGLYSTIRTGGPVQSYVGNPYAAGYAGNPYVAGNGATGIGLQLGPAPQEGNGVARRRKFAVRSVLGY